MALPESAFGLRFVKIVCNDNNDYDDDDGDSNSCYLNKIKPSENEGYNDTRIMQTINGKTNVDKLLAISQNKISHLNIFERFLLT